MDIKLGVEIRRKYWTEKDFIVFLVPTGALFVEMRHYWTSYYNTPCPQKSPVLFPLLLSKCIAIQV